MDFWRAYRVLAARKWLITAIVILTTMVVGIGILLYGRKFDGQTGFGPTDQAVRANANSLNEKNTPILNDDSRMEEAKRIATEINAPYNAARALAYLTNIRQIRQRLDDAFGKPVCEVGQPPVLDTIQKNVNAAKAKLSELSDTDRKELARGVPEDLWPAFIFLDAKARYPEYRIPQDFPEPGRMSDLLQHIDVNILNSRSVTLSVRDNNPYLAEILADALTASYRYWYDRDKLNAAQSAQDYLAKQQRDATDRYKIAKDNLAHFRRSHPDVFLPDQVNLAVRTNETTRQDVDTLNAGIEDMNAQIAAKRARLASLPRMLKHPVQADSTEIASLRTKISDLNAQIAEKSAVWTDKNPEMVRLRAQLQSLQARLHKVEGSLVTTTTYTENDEYLSLEREIARLVQTRDGMTARLAQLNSVLAKHTQLVAALPEASTSAQILSASLKSSADRLEDLNKKLANAKEELNSATANGALRMTYWAGLTSPDADPIPAREGSKARNWAMLAAAFVLSLVGSAAVILGLDYLDTSVKSPIDVERMLDNPVTGVVPRLDGVNHAMLPQVTHKLPASPQAESYRFLGTDILLSAAGDQPFTSIMVATAKPGQGGTSTICNLAITLAQAGQSVALVDADLRRPSLHTIFNVPNEQGLTNILSNGKLPSDVLQRTDIENLYVMTGGPKADNAWQLLRSPKMKEVIADLQRDFDFVLFDTPSAVVFADAATIATMVDGVLLVVRAHEAPSGSELQVKNLLNKTKARIVGVVLNDMPVQQVDSARYFSHYYGDTTRPEVGSGTGAGASRPALPKRATDDEI